MRHAVALALLMLGVVAASCGGSDSATDSIPAEAVPVTVRPTTTTTSTTTTVLPTTTTVPRPPDDVAFLAAVNADPELRAYVDWHKPHPRVEGVPSTDDEVLVIGRRVCTNMAASEFSTPELWLEREEEFWAGNGQNGVVERRWVHTAIAIFCADMTTAVDNQVAGIVPLPVPEPTPRITFDEWQRLTDGMTRDQAAEIVGSYGSTDAESGISGDEFHTVLVSWSGEGSVGANANAMFQGGRLVSKAQFGLR